MADKSGQPVEADRLDVLRRMMVRLTVLVEEQDGNLGRLMNELRQLLRQPGVDPALLDEVLQQAETDQESDQAATATARKHLIETLRGLNGQLREQSPRRDRELDELDHALDLRTRDLPELTRYLQDYSRVQRRVSHSLSGVQAGQQALAETEGLARRAADGSGLPPDRMLAEVFSAVTGLANRIQLPPEQQNHLQEVIRELNRSIEWPDLMQLLNRLTELIVAVLNDEQQALEQYLEDLNARLSLIRSSVQKAQKIRAQFQNEGQQLDHRIQNHVATIRREMQSAQSLVELKTGVQSELDNLVSSIDEFLRHSTEKEESMARMMAEMVDVIADLEQQNQTIRDDFERTRRQALTDVLTGLPNRSAYLQRLEQELARCERTGRPMTLCVLDVDHFKQVNDRLGHLAGDRVLKILARQLKRWIRKVDFISRHGGEEFVILMPETGLRDAVAAMDKLCRAVSEAPFHFRGQPVAITVSIGCSELAAGQDAEEAFDRADQAMYRAKENGRNRVMGT